MKKIRNGTSLKNVVFLIKKIACSSLGSFWFRIDGVQAVDHHLQFLKGIYFFSFVQYNNNNNNNNIFDDFVYRVIGVNTKYMLIV